MAGGAADSIEMSISRRKIDLICPRSRVDIRDNMNVESTFTDPFKVEICYDVSRMMSRGHSSHDILLYSLTRAEHWITVKVFKPNIDIKAAFAI